MLGTPQRASGAVARDYTLQDTIEAASLEPADCSARMVVVALDAYVSVTPSATQQAQITTDSLDTQITLVPCP